MGVRSSAVVILLVLALAAPWPGSAQMYTRPLEVELSLDLDPVVQEGVGASIEPFDTESATRRLLAEARGVISGMIYGYQFVYTPAEADRGVAESFVLTPLAVIPLGDEALAVAGTRLEDRRLTVLFRYGLNAEQQARRQAWSSAVLAKSEGLGAANVFLGYSQRTTALENAVKESIRGHLRPTLQNRPKEVRGDIVLWEVLPTRIRAGEYNTQVVTRLRVQTVIPYRVY